MWEQEGEAVPVHAAGGTTTGETAAICRKSRKRVEKNQRREKSMAARESSRHACLANGNAMRALH